MRLTASILAAMLLTPCLALADAPAAPAPQQQQPAPAAGSADDAPAADLAEDDEEPSFIRATFLEFKPAPNLHPKFEEKKLIFLAGGLLGTGFFAPVWLPLAMIKPAPQPQWGDIIKSAVINIALMYGGMIGAWVPYIICGVIFPPTFYVFWIPAIVAMYAWLGYRYWMGTVGMFNYWNRLYKKQIKEGLITEDGSAPVPAADAKQAEEAAKAAEEAKKVEEAKKAEEAAKAAEEAKKAEDAKKAEEAAKAAADEAAKKGGKKKK